MIRPIQVYQLCRCVKNIESIMTCECRFQRRREVLVWTNGPHSSMVHVQITALAFKSFNLIHGKSHTMAGLFGSIFRLFSKKSYAKFDNNFTHCIVYSCWCWFNLNHHKWIFYHLIPGKKSTTSSFGSSKQPRNFYLNA